MMNKWAVATIACAVLAAFAAGTLILRAHLLVKSGGDVFFYNPSKNPIEYVGSDMGKGAETLEEQEIYTRQLSDGSRNTKGVIAIGEVAGGSINRIITPPAAERAYDVVYGSNHVITPKDNESHFSRGWR